MRVIFMGTPQPVVSTLERLAQHPGVQVVAAVTQPDRQGGRGRRSQPTPVKEAAQRLAIPVLQPDTLRSPGVREQLSEFAPDVVVVAAYGKFLPPSVLEMPPHGCLNLHPSLLPRHRGPSPVATAILEGDEITGVSLMLLDEGMDTGPVIGKREHPLTGEETAGELTDHLFEMGASLLVESLEPWTSGDLIALPQDESTATVSRKLERTDGLADWSLSADTLARQCRAYAPWPGLYTHWQGKTLKVLQANSSSAGHVVAHTPGQVTVTATGNDILVSTGDGSLALKRVQLEGRRPVAAEEFLRGYPDFIGSVLGDR